MASSLRVLPASVNVFKQRTELPVKLNWQRFVGKGFDFIQKIEYPYFGEVVGDIFPGDFEYGRRVCLMLPGGCVRDAFVVKVLWNDRNCADPLVLFSFAESPSEYTFSVIMPGDGCDGYHPEGVRHFYIHWFPNEGREQEPETKLGMKFGMKRQHCFLPHRALYFQLETSSIVPRCRRGFVPSIVPPRRLPAQAAGSSSSTVAAEMPAPTVPSIISSSSSAAVDDDIGRMDNLERAHLSVVLAASRAAAASEAAAASAAGHCRLGWRQWPTRSGDKSV